MTTHEEALNSTMLATSALASLGAHPQLVRDMQATVEWVATDRLGE